MKVITIDSLNNGIFSFVSFSSQRVMLMAREPPYMMSKRCVLLYCDGEPTQVDYPKMSNNFDQQLALFVKLIEPKVGVSNNNGHAIK
jgi:hypothetical protein